MERHEKSFDVSSSVVALHLAHVVELVLARVHVRGIGEEHSGGSAREATFNEADLVG